MHADEIFRLGPVLGKGIDRQGRRVGGEDRIRPHHGQRFCRRLGLDGAILEHRLDHQIDAGERRIIGGRNYARQDRSSASGVLRPLATAVESSEFGMTLALVGGGLIAVDQHDFDPCQRTET